MTIRYLEIFVEVCKYMNMSRAAQSLMISQSSVSQGAAQHNTVPVIKKASAAIKSRLWLKLFFSQHKKANCF